MFSLIGMAVVVFVILGVVFKIKFSPRNRSINRRLSAMYKRFVPLTEQVDDALHTMKEKAVSLMTNANGIERKAQECKDTVMSKRAHELADKMKAKAQELATKAREYEDRKATLFAEKELLETMVEFTRMEKGLIDDGSPFVSLQDLEKQIKTMEDEVNALNALKF